MLAIRTPILLLAVFISFSFLLPEKKEIYHNGWIDLNKNGHEDVYEDPKASIENRVNDLLSQMMLEENGAEALLGHGDLLFKTTGEPVRLQAPLLEDDERIELFGSSPAHTRQ